MGQADRERREDRRGRQEHQPDEHRGDEQPGPLLLAGARAPRSTAAADAAEAQTDPARAVRGAAGVVGHGALKPRPAAGGVDHRMAHWLSARIWFSWSLTDGDRILGGLVGSVEDVLVELRLERRRELVVALERRLEVRVAEGVGEDLGPVEGARDTSCSRICLLTGTDAFRAMIFSWASGLARYLTSAQAASGDFVPL